MVVTGLLGFLLIAARLGTSAVPKLVRDHARLLRFFQIVAGGGVAATIISVVQMSLAEAWRR
jgi:hypothetical protein